MDVVFSNGFTWFLTWLDILVGGLEHDFYFSIYWEKSSQLTNSYFYIFFTGVSIPPTRLDICLHAYFGTMIPPLIALSIFLGFSQARGHHGIAPDSGGFCEEAVPCRKSLSNIAGETLAREKKMRVKKLEGARTARNRGSAACWISWSTFTRAGGCWGDTPWIC